MAAQSTRQATTITLTLIQGTANIKVPNAVRIRRMPTEAEETNVTVILTRETATIRVPNSMEIRRLPAEGSYTIIEVVSPRSSKLIDIVRWIENACLLLLACTVTMLQFLLALFPPSAKQKYSFPPSVDSFPPSANQNNTAVDKDAIDISKGVLTMFLFLSYAAAKYLREHLESLSEDVVWPVLLIVAWMVTFGRSMGIILNLLFQVVPAMFRFIFKYFS